MLKHLLLSFTLVIISVGMISVGNAAETVLAPQISNDRGVKVTVTPLNLSNKAKTWDFEVTLETHTQNLDADLAKSSVLIVDEKQYAPLVREGAPPGGHHRKGRLRFKALTPQQKAVELKIHLTGEDAPRSFPWNLKGVGNGN